jgi:hypothetical protein
MFMSKKLYYLLSLFSFLFISSRGFAQAPPVQWQNSYGGASFDEGVSIRPTTDGGYVIAGSSLSSNGDISSAKGGFDMWVVKVDVLGNLFWQTSIGDAFNQYTTSVDNTLDGGYIIAGYTDTSAVNQRDFYLVKLDADGLILWEKKYGGTGNDMANSVYHTTDGGYIVAGTSNSLNGDVHGNQGSYDFWVIKVDMNGDTLWTKTLGGSGYDEAKSVQQTNDGGYVIAGHTYSTNGSFSGNNGKADYLVIKLDATGNTIQFSETFGGSNDDFATFAEQTSDGGYIVSCTSFSNDSDVTGHHGITTTSDCWIVKLDGAGAFQWGNSYGGSSIDGAAEVHQIIGGDYVFGGFVKSSDGDVSGNHPLFDFWLASIDNSGNLLWQKPLGGSNDDKMSSFLYDSDGGFVMAGVSQSSDGDVTLNRGDRDYWVVKAGGNCILPSVDFNLSSSGVCPGTEVLFDNTTFGTVTDYKWKIDNIDYSTARDTGRIFVTPGTYSIRLIAYKGSSCVDSTTKTLTVYSNPATPSVSASGLSYCKGDNVTLTSSSFTGNQWYKNGVLLNGENGQNYIANDTLTATYSVVVTSSDGCTAGSPDTTVQVNSLPPAATIYAVNDTICQGDSVSLQTTTGFSYLWSNSETTSSISVKNAGTYSVTITNANGCSRAVNPVDIFVNPLPSPVITPSSSTTFCAGDSVKLLANSGFSSYRWSNGPATAAITVRTSGSYTVTVTDGTTKCSNTAGPVAVTANAKPTPLISAAAGDTLLCAGESVELSSPAGSAYQWFKNNNAISAAAGQTYSADSTGAYSVKITDANGCTGFSNLIQVRVDTIPSPKIKLFGSSSVCAGQSVTAQAASGHSSYLWSNGSTSQTTALSASGTYTCTVTSAAGCSVVSDPVTITIKPKPVATISASGAVSICPGDSVTLSADNNPALAAFSWSNGFKSKSIVVRQSGKYFLSATDTSGCPTDTSNNITVTVNPSPASTITGSGPLSFCEGSSVTLSVSPGNTYAWSNSATSSSIVSDTTGTYTVTVTSSAGCTSSASISTVTNPLPNAKIIAKSSTTFCQGESVALVDSSNESNATYKWSIGSSGPFISATQPGTYTLTVTSSKGCSKASNSILVKVNSLPVVSISPSGATTFCKGGSVNLTATGSNYAYTWDGRPDTTRIISVSKSGSYFVQARDSNGCSNKSNTIVVSVVNNPSVSITASGPLRFCEGDSVKLTATGGLSSYKWSTGAVSSSIQVKQNGTYSVSVTNNTGCSGNSTPVNVIVDSLPPVPTVNVTLNLLQSSSSTGNQWYYNGTKIDSADGQTYLATKSGSYKVVVTNSFGCSSESVPVIVNLSTNSIEEASQAVLMDIFPNPFTDRATIRYELARTTQVTLEVYNLLGERVALLAGEKQGAGTYSYSFGNKDATASGTYIVKLVAGDKVYNRRLIQVR